MLQEKFRELEDLLLSRVRAFYGERLVSFAIFGSVARGSQNFESDLDVLIIADPLPQGRMRRIREFEGVEDEIEPFLNSLRKDGIHSRISAVIKSPEEARRGSPLFLDMVEDAVILFDREGFFANLLKRMRERLQSLGARRVWNGNAWYWILKPDFRPGEVFEI